MRDDQQWLQSDPASPGFTLDTSPFYWLTRVSGRYLLVMERRLKAIGMDVPRWRVLMTLAEDEPASVTTLSDRAVVKLTTMTRIVQRMEAAGLVATAQSSSDGRVTQVSMSPAGQVALARVRAEGSRVFGTAFADLDGAEIGRLIALLGRVFDGLAEPALTAAERYADGQVAGK